LRTIGLDIGEKRIGVAVSDPLGILASPLTVLERKSDLQAVEDILKLAEKHQAGLIISGMPRSMDGSLGVQAEKVKSFIDILKNHSSVPVDFRDERLTTSEASRMMRESGNKKYGRGRKVVDDAAAAAVILQSYLNEFRPLEYPPQ
jgi:putative holliday junction resolvase